MGKNFEDLEVWKKSQDLAILMYDLIDHRFQPFFRDQICSAAVSVSNNISEGYERGGAKEFIRFLRIAKGSCGEVRNMLYLVKRKSIIHDPVVEDLIGLCRKISAMLSNLIKSIRSKIN